MATSSSAPDIPPFVAVILNQYASALRPAFGFILISAISSALLVPLCVMLLWVSTPSSRKRPVFIITMVSIVLGLSGGILGVHNTVIGALSPTTGSDAREVFAYGVFFAWLAWITELVLIFRVLVLYQSSTRRHQALVIAFPVLMKIARAGMIIHFLVVWRKATSTAHVQQFSLLENVPKWIHEATWIMELFDNAYISLLFLCRLASAGHIFNGQTVGRDSTGEQNTFTRRLRSLFCIATTNFIFPVICGIIEIAFLFQPSLQLVASEVYAVNIYVSIISTGFASVWAGTPAFKDSDAHRTPSHFGSPHEPKLETMAFAHTDPQGAVTTISMPPPSTQLRSGTTSTSEESMNEERVDEPHSRGDKTGSMV